MFIKIILNYIMGYVRIIIEGYYIERFINICTNKKITIWNLKREENIRISLNVGVKEFKEISKIAKKTKCKLKIKRKKGFPFLLNRYKKRKIFLILLLAVIISIIVSSQYVWNIDIIEENNQTIENIYRRY